MCLALRMLVLMTAILIGFQTLASSVTAIAQEPSAAAAGLPTGDLNRLLATLEDESTREQFIATLKAAIKAQEAAAPKATAALPALGVGGITFVTKRIEQLTSAAVTVGRSLTDVALLQRWFADLFLDIETRRILLDAFVKLVVVFSLAVAGFYVTMRGIASTVRPLRLPVDSGMSRKAAALLGRAMIDLLPLLVFIAVAFLVLPFTVPRPQTRFVAVSLVNATLVVQASLLISRAVLAPYAPELRLFRLEDGTAAYLYVWIRRIVYLSLYGLVFSQSLLALGLGAAAREIMLHLVGLLVATMLVMLVLQNHRAVATWLLGNEEKRATRSGAWIIRRQLAEFWHIVAIVYVVGTYIVWALQIPGGFAYLFEGTIATIIVFTLARLLSRGVRRTIHRGLTVGPGLRARYPTLEHRANRYVPVAGGVFRAVLYSLATVISLAAWDVDVIGALGSATGRSAVADILTILLVAALAIVFWEGVSTFIESYLYADDEEDVDRQLVSARMRTLLPLIRNAILVVLIVVVGLIVLAQLGVDTRPLLAAAGVVGLAIGFGSQKLVQDVINGMFILMEDTITVGDVVDLGGNAGLVEGMTIRTITLRNLAGEVYTIPFSEVSTVLNKTKDFSFAVLDVGVAYREDISLVMDVIVQVGAELQTDAQVGSFILEPLEMLGLDRFDDSAIIVRARIKTKPIKQFAVARAFNLRLKERFDELSIEIPFPHLTLYFGQDKAGQSPPAQVLVEERASGDAGLTSAALAQLANGK